MSSVSLIDGHIDYPRMTDNEIIKALEWCNSVSNRCGDGCPYYNVPYKNGLRCSEMMINDAIDLINRQTAEIENLNRAFDVCKKEYEDIFEIAKNQKAEIERLKDEVQKQKEKTNDVIRSYVEDEWC